MKKKFGSVKLKLKNGKIVKAVRMEKSKTKVELKKIRDRYTRDKVISCRNTNNFLCCSKKIIFKKWRECSFEQKFRTKFRLTPMFPDVSYPGENSLDDR